MNDNLPPGTIACREYRVPIEDGGMASIAFTLADLAANTAAGDLARTSGAVAYGLVSLLDWPDAPAYPVVWTQGETQVDLAVADEDDDLPEEVADMIARYLLLFFADMRSIAPDLASFTLPASPAPLDRNKLN